MFDRIRVPLVLLVVMVVCAFTLVGCGGATPADKTDQSGAASEQPAGQTDTSTIPEEPQLYTPAYQPNGSEKAVIKTSKGSITVELFGKDAPVNVGNFIELAQKGFYDGTKFHRFEPGFVIQGGDPQTKKLTAEQVIQAVQTGSVPLGTGGPGYTVKGEFDPAVNPNKHVKYALGMARAQSPDSAGSQFYFALVPLAQLDGGYTVFGVATAGQNVIDQLRVGDEIESVTIQGAK